MENRVISSEERNAALYPNTKIQIISQSNPELNAFYAVTKEAQYNAAAIVLFTVVNDRFPPDQDVNNLTYTWLDAEGRKRKGFTMEQFRALASAMASYASQVDHARANIANGETEKWPRSVFRIP